MLKATNDRLSSEDVTLEKLAGGGAALAAGAYVGGRVIKGGIGKLLGAGGSLAVGVATGKALESAAGVTPVFVTNMPSDGLLGKGDSLLSPKAGIPTPKPASAGSAIGDAAAAGAGWGLGAEIAKTAKWLRTLAGTAVLDLPALGAGGMVGAAGGIGLAGAAGYSLGLYAYDNWISDYVKDRIGFAVAKGLSPISQEAKESVAINENKALRAKLAGLAGSPPPMLAHNSIENGMARDTLSNFLGHSLDDLASSQNRSGQAVERALQSIGGDLEAAINSSNMADRIGQIVRDAVAQMAEKKAQLTIKVDGPGKVTASQVSGFDLNVKSGLLPVGR